jgi:superfamily II DNA/RNA helicase
MRESQQSKLAKNGITELFPVQKACYNLFVNGREIIVKSRTGTGKTLAFLLPIEELAIRDYEEGNEDGSISALVLEPTRELANQVEK